MRVLLLSANTEMIPDPACPSGPAYAGAAAKAAGHGVEVVDLRFATDGRAPVRWQIDADDNLPHPKFYVSESLGDELTDRIEAHARSEFQRPLL